MRLLLTALFLLPLLSPTAWSEEGEAAVRFTITGADGKPIEGVEVGVWNGEGAFPATTNKDGVGTVTGVTPGRCTLWIAGTGYVRQEQRSRIEPDGLTVAFTLERGTPFQGRIIDTRGKPVPRAYVQVNSGGTFEGYSRLGANAAVLERTYASDTGLFHVRGIPTDTVATVVVKAPGFETARIGVRERNGSVRPHDLEIVLHRGARASVTVFNPAGKPIEDALVFVVPADAHMLRQNPRVRRISSDGKTRQALYAYTDEDGTAILEGLAFGTEYVALGEAGGLARTESEVFMATRAKPYAEVTITMEELATLVLKVVDKQGSPVTTAKVQVGDLMRGLEAEPDSPPGTWRYLLSAGVHSIEIRSDDFLAQMFEIELKAGSTTERTVTLSEGETISGVVVDQHGKPVPDVGVSAEPEHEEGTPWSSEDTGRATTDADGRFEIRGLKRVEHEVTVDGRNFGTTAQLKITAPAKDIRIAGTWLGILRLRLVVPEGAKLPEDIDYWRHDPDGGGSGSGKRLDDEGRVEFLGFHSPERLSVQAEGFVPMVWELDIKPGETRDLGVVELRVGATARGLVVDPSGAPIEGADIYWGIFRSSVTTDEQGAFTMRHLPDGKTEVTVQSKGFVPLESSVSSGKAARLVLSRGEVVTGTARDPGGDPLGGHWIQIRKPDAKGVWHEVDFFETDEDGTFEVRLPTGLTRLVFRRDRDTEPQTLVEFKAKEGGTREVDVTIK